MNIQPIPEKFIGLDISRKRTGPRPKKVQVVAMDKETYRQYANIPGRNGRIIVRQVEVGQVFESISEAEAYLGATKGALSAALAHGRKKNLAYGVVRGVALTPYN